MKRIEQDSIKQRWKGYERQTFARGTGTSKPTETQTVILRSEAKAKPSTEANRMEREAIADS